MANTNTSLIPDPAQKDRVAWNLSNDRIHSAKTALPKEYVSHLPLGINVFGSHHTPRWAFIEWVSLIGRLATKDRLIGWGMYLDANSVLCVHLFFECPYSNPV